MTESIQLREFNPASIPQNSTYIIIGMRNTGKTSVIKDLLTYRKDVPYGVIITPTDKKEYSGLVPDDQLHETYSTDIIDGVRKRQGQVISEYQKEEKQEGTSNIDRRGFLVLDNVMYDTSWIKDSNLLTFIMNPRTYRLSLFISMSYAMGIPPAIRTCFDYIFILRESIPANRKRLYEHYAGMFPTFESFCQVMDDYTTSDYTCLVIDNLTSSKKLEDRVFYYKAKLL